MSDIKTLRAYANGRKLPEFKLITNISKEWLEYAYQEYLRTPISSDYAKEQREADGILGTEVEEYEDLTTYYNQSYVDNILFPEEFNLLDGLHHIRFGELKHSSTIPFHIDEPFTLRTLCVIKGEHKFISETGAETMMYPGEWYFVNGCFKHSVINTGDCDRIAVLSKYNISDHNVSIITT